MISLFTCITCGQEQNVFEHFTSSIVDRLQNTLESTLCDSNGKGAGLNDM